MRLTLQDAAKWLTTKSIYILLPTLLYWTDPNYNFPFFKKKVKLL